MEREVVAFDLDSVICNTELVILEHLKRQYNLYLNLEDLIDYDFGNIPYITEEMEKDLEDAIHNGRLVNYKKPYPDVYEGFNLLHDNGFEVNIITSRKKSLWGMTYDWLKYYKIDFEMLYLCSKPEKWEKLVEIQAKAFTEDHFGTINMILENEVELPYGLIVMDQPWNYKYFHKDVSRVYSFLDACEYIVIQKNLLNSEVK